MEIDSTNRRILALLKENARMSAAEVGRLVGLSRPAVQERIAAMERAGIIDGYHTIIGESAGLVHAVLFVQIAERPCEKALKWLLTLDGVTSAVSLAGDLDALVFVSAPSVGDLSALNDKVLGSPLIKAAKSNIVLRRLNRS